MIFGKRLKKIRKEAGITQKELADKIGVSRTTIAGYETEGKEPSYDNLIKIARALNCSLDVLLDYQNKENQSDHQVKLFYEKLSQREDLQLLLKETEDLNPDSVKRIVKIIDLIKEEKNSGRK